MIRDYTVERMGGLDEKFYIEKDRIRQRNKTKNYFKNKRIYSEKAKIAHLKSTYGLTSEDYHAMIKVQDGKCLICKREIKLSVDHCHTTNRIRGLLCVTCNTGLGSFKDNIEYLENAIEYLKNNL